MKKATYLIEFEVDDDFVAGDCCSCPYNRIEYSYYDDDGYGDVDIIEHCDLGIDGLNDCLLQVIEDEALYEKKP